MSCITGLSGWSVNGMEIVKNIACQSNVKLAELITIPDFDSYKELSCNLARECVNISYSEFEDAFCAVASEGIKQSAVVVEQAWNAAGVGSAIAIGCGIAAAAAFALHPLLRDKAATVAASVGVVGSAILLPATYLATKLEIITFT